MMIGRSVLAFICAAVLLSGFVGRAAGAEHDAGATLNVLWLGDGGLHKPAERLRQLAPVMLRRGMHLHYTEDIGTLNAENLARYDALMIYANIDAIGADHERALVRYVEEGGGLVALHCASYCFRNSSKYIELVGAQFKSHGTGDVTTRVTGPDHPLMRGFEPFVSWDETYVHHQHNEAGRTVLETREGEPWTWVRPQGKGRVFYTAWGHDQRTFSNAGFHDLVERGIRWAAGQVMPDAMAAAATLKPFEHVEQKVAYYPPGAGRTGDGVWNRMQLPLPPEESMKHYVTPAGFEVQLFAAEPDIRKPLCMAWDERGRLWIGETMDYPNELQQPGQGRDRITICEDSDGDGRADKFTVFADKLSIPTSMLFSNGGVIVHQPPQTIFMRDTDGDDRADERRVLLDGWSTKDTHAGPNNLAYGFDNWIWGMVGYSGFEATVGGEPLKFDRGFYRFRPDGSKLESIRATNNNTWGIGFSEEGIIFGSTANNNPSVYMPIANRYYDRVRGSQPQTLGGIADTARFLPITENVRQVDVHWGYTSAAGHALYTARTYPKEYWNKRAFVADPTGKLIGTFLLEREGANFTSRNPENLVASDDEWAAPIMAEVGPDGHVWFIDWYNYIVQHNPTPQGYETGAGNAYVTDLRDKRHARIYRVVYKAARLEREPMTLCNATPAKLVASLSHDNLLWRRHAQRLLVERGNKDVAAALLGMIASPQVDDIGLNVGAIHALWTLHGLGMLDGSDAAALEAVVAALRHPSAGVRRNAAQVLPATEQGREALLAANVFEDADAQVRLAALLSMADMPASDGAGAAVYAMLKDQRNGDDRWIPDAAAAAAVKHVTGFLAAAGVDEAQRGSHAAHQHQHQPANLLPNASFEEMEGERPAAWRVRKYQGEADHRVVKVDFARTGERCLVIHADAGSDTSWCIDVPVEPGKQYRLSGYVRTRGLQKQSGAGALLNVHGTDARTSALTRANEWTRLSTVFESGNRNRVSINCLFGGWGTAIGTAWFDDLSLVEVQSGTNAGLDRVLTLIGDHVRGGRPVEAEQVDDGSRVIELGVVEGLMRYNKTRLTVKAGEKIRIVFNNTDHMLHNLLILKPGSLERVGAAADQMMLTPQGLELQYVPRSPDVLASTPLVNPSSRFVLSFTAPSEPGEYPYVCTFPGHWRLMQGVLVVEPR